MSPASSLQWFLLALPATVLFAYFLTAFPHVSSNITIHPSLATLPKDSASWEIYPDTYFEGGEYVRFPQGTVSHSQQAFRATALTGHAPQVRYWLIGPEDGERVGRRLLRDSCMSTDVA